jgi:hypothetical protein
VLQQHCFAAAAAADDRGDFACFQLQIDAFENLLAAKAAIEIDDANHGIRA